MQSCWLVCCVMMALTVQGMGEGKSEYDWTGSIHPGTTRERLEKIVFTPDSDGDLSRRLYETRDAQVDEYPFDDGWAMVVPFQRLRVDPSVDGNYTRARRQKVVAKPWMMIDKVVTVGEAKEPYLRIPLPERAGKDAHRAEETAHILAGDIFRNGREVALVAYSSQAGTEYSLDALALYRKKGGRWALRSFFPADNALQAFAGVNDFIALAELSGDETPEVTLCESQGRNSGYAVFRYDPRKDRLVLAVDSIVNPERKGNAVASYEHNGSGAYAESRYAWRGGKLVPISRTDQEIGATDLRWIEPPKTPAGAENDFTVCLRHSERNAATGRIDNWESAGNVGWLLGGGDFSGTNQKLDPLLWTVFQIGQLRRTVLITPKAKAMAARSIKPADVDLSDALFAKPERFNGDTMVKLPRGKTVRLKDVAKVAVRDERPAIMSSHEVVWWSEENFQAIPPLSLWVGRQEWSIETWPMIPREWARSRQNESGAAPSRHFGRSVTIGLYVVGPDCDPTAHSLKFEDARLEAGNVVRVTCTAEGKPAKTDGPKGRSALVVNLGRFDIGEYKAVVNFKPAEGGPAIATRELSFVIEK